MKAVIGLLLIFTGLTVGYLVIAGRLPTGSTSVIQQAQNSPGGIIPETPVNKKTGGGPAITGYPRGFDVHVLPTVRGYHV